tara:strand:+ start:7797 stop:9398 length:1602 start_codon:yes stop_codon:yes gene_type:complete
MQKFLLYLIYFNFIVCSIINDYNYLGLSDDAVLSDLTSNAIYEMIALNDTLWLRTGSGLSFVVFNNNIPLFHSVDNNNLPVGGAPAFIIDGSMMVISGSKPIYENEKYRPMGTGISWSIDSGNNWNYINQPLDENPDVGVYTYSSWGNQDSLAFKAITTDIYNISYDLDIMGDYIYAASFAGGFRRFNYTLNNPEWELIPLPMDNQATLLCNNINLENYEYDPVNPPEGNDNHKAFSVFINNNIIWVGTGDGINKGIIDLDTQCIDWTHYNESDGMGDRWVIGIKNQQFDSTNRLWAISWDPSLNAAIPHNLSYTDDQGNTWHITSFFKDIGAIVYDLDFDDEEVYASTSLGLYKTYNGNIDLWFKYDISDFNEQPLLTDAIYHSNIFSNTILDQNTLWAGSPDGIFYSYDNGVVWHMYRSWNHTIDSEDDNKRLSAYPNPFYIDEVNQYNSDGHVRIVYYNDDVNSNVILDIFDFNMTHIINLDQPTIINSEGQFIWNGRDKFSNQVQNGIYFCRLKLSGKIYWTKLMVINT